MGAGPSARRKPVVYYGGGEKNDNTTPAAAERGFCRAEPDPKDAKSEDVQNGHRDFPLEWRAIMTHNRLPGGHAGVLVIREHAPSVPPPGSPSPAGTALIAVVVSRSRHRVRAVPTGSPPSGLSSRAR